jgi:hypothetical protein
MARYRKKPVPTHQDDAPDLAAALGGRPCRADRWREGTRLNVDWAKVAEFVQAVLPVILRFVK